MATEDLAGDADQIAELIGRVVTQLQAGVVKRMEGWSTINQGWSDFLAGVETAGYKPFLLISAIAAAGILVAAATLAISSFLSERVFSGRAGRVASYLCAAIASIVIGSLLSQWLAADHALRNVLLSVIWTSAIATMICTGLAGGNRHASYHPWLRDIAVAVALAAITLVLQAVLRAWNASFPLRDLFGTVAIALPFAGLMIFAYLRHRRVISQILSFGSGVGSWRRRMATAWPFLVVLIVALAFIFTQIALTLGLAVHGGPVLLSLLLVLAGPHIDAAVELRSRRAIQSEDGELAGALWRTLRILVAASILAVLTFVWFLPLLNAAGISSSAVLMKTSEILLVVLIVAFLWNWVSILSQHLRRLPSAEIHVADAPTSRLGTVGPLLVALAKAALLVLGSLTTLVLLNINVWPLITGFSIFGLAIGLGSQTLVKDIVAGLFFLFDDAFRHGEYIETSGAKGTVEKISVRSVSLRHPRGAVATIPYGQIGKIQNFSREWVIEKIPFRVALGTDVELVRKLFKQVGKEIADDPDLNADLLEPFKCQGITALDEGTIIIQGKFKAKAGKQFPIKKAVLTKVMKALEENGIALGPKPL